MMLSHLRVVDMLDDFGAIAGRMFAELGAQVVRVPIDAASQRSPAWNEGTSLAAFGPADPEFASLVEDADILLRPADARLDHLGEGHPRLIEVILSAFMPNGEAGQRPVSELSLLARSGLMSIMGDPDRAPMRMPGRQAYALAGIQAVTAALAALRHRTATGQGQRVDVSAFQSAVHANYRDPVTWAWTGRIGKRTGNLLVRGTSGVRQMWRCADGFVTWSLLDNPPMMRAMVKVMGDAAGPLAEVDWDNVLVANLPRETLENWEETVAAFLARHSRAELGALSSEHGLGLSYIDTPGDVLASPHLEARDFWRQSGPARLPGRLWRSSIDNAGDRL